MTTGRATKATSIARPGRSPPASTATGSRIDGPKTNGLLALSPVRGRALLGRLLPRRPLAAPPEHGEHAEHHDDEQQGPEPGDDADAAERDGDELDDPVRQQDHRHEEQDHERDA